MFNLDISPPNRTPCCHGDYCVLPRSSAPGLLLICLFYCLFNTESGLIRISALGCWISFNEYDYMGGQLILPHSGSQKRQNWDEVK